MRTTTKILLNETRWFAGLVYTLQIQLINTTQNHKTTAKISSSTRTTMVSEPKKSYFEMILSNILQANTRGKGITLPVLKKQVAEENGGAIHLPTFRKTLALAIQNGMVEHGVTKMRFLITQKAKDAEAARASEAKQKLKAKAKKAASAAKKASKKKKSTRKKAGKKSTKKRSKPKKTIKKKKASRSKRAAKKATRGRRKK